MWTVVALYRFQTVPDPKGLAAVLRAACDENAVCGTLIVAREGINGTIEAAQMQGPPQPVAAATRGFSSRGHYSCRHY
jgi:predicted sulfurtransferase